MKQRKITLTVVLIGGVAAYAIAFLTYFTLKYWLNNSADNISAFGSILGAVGAFFAAFIATYLFNDWKDQHNKQVQNTFAIQVFDSFSIFEKNILEYSLFISHLQELRSSYENYELTWEILNKDGNIIYIQNINTKKDELDLSFYKLISKLKNYYIFNNNKEEFKKNHEIYFNKFTEINKNLLPSYRLVDVLIEHEARYIGCKDLLNLIDLLDIQNIIKNSSAQ